MVAENGNKQNKKMQEWERQDDRMIERQNGRMTKNDGIKKGTRAHKKFHERHHY